MLTIRFYHGNYWNPLHLLIMAATRSRVVHCDIFQIWTETDKHGDKTTHYDAMESAYGKGVYFTSISNHGDKEYDFRCDDGLDFESLIGTPYDYASCLAYVWPWVRQSPTRMNCVEVCLWAMEKAGLPVPKWLPTPKGLLRWCEKMKKGEVRC